MLKPEVGQRETGRPQTFKLSNSNDPHQHMIYGHIMILLNTAGNRPTC